MRDKRFITEKRGGLLTIEQHHALMQWAVRCVEHALFLMDGSTDYRIDEALLIGKEWIEGKATVGDARKASVEAHSFARELSNSIKIAIARAAGHAVATAHMADHSLGAALYALKAFKIAGHSVIDERKWQNDQLTPDIKEIVLALRDMKEKSFHLA